jgi:hypothetical protein
VWFEDCNGGVSLEEVVRERMAWVSEVRGKLAAG